MPNKLEEMFAANITEYIHKIRNKNDRKIDKGMNRQFILR